MNPPIIDTTRAILFRRVYNDDSGMPEYPQGSTRSEVIPFDCDAHKFSLVNRIIDHPELLEPYLLGPIQSVRLRRHGDPQTRQGLEFAMSTKLSDELRDKDVPRYANHIDAPGGAAEHDHEVSMTFDVSHHAAKIELALWIEAKLFHAFVHPDAAIYYTAITNVTEHPGYSPPYRAAHPMAVPISDPFGVAAPAAAPAPANPPAPSNQFAADSDNNDDNLPDAAVIQEIVDDQEERVAAAVNADSDDDSGIPQPDPDSDEDDDEWGEADPVPLASAESSAGAETDAQMLRRVSDELFAVQQEMPDQLYLRLSNALKRRRPN